MQSATWMTLMVAAMLLSAFVVLGQPEEKMVKYYKRTGQKFLDEKAKV
jgi:hypothetical protein